MNRDTRNAIERATQRSRKLLEEDFFSQLEGTFDVLRNGSGLPESLRFIRERVQSLNVAPERPRPGHLYACNLSQSGYAGRAHLFVVGLEEGRVFSSSTEDAVLLDSERDGISAELRVSTDRIDEAVYAVLSRLGASAASATFS